jgi:LacI family transcriptional regulator
MGVEKVVEKSGYMVVLCNTFRHAETEKNYLNMLYDKRVMGVVISAFTENGDNVAEFARKGMEFVLLDQQIEGINCNSINFDFHQGGRLAAEYLINKGHKKIALITTPITRWSRSEIYKGYINTLASNIKFQMQPIVFEGDTEQEDDAIIYENLVGRQMAKKFIEEKCDATGAVCVNDMVALGFIQELNKGNIRVPEDVSVIGFDDIPFASMFSPSLTTVRCAALDVGMVAGRILLDRIEGRAVYESSLKIEPKIIERDTVKELKGG